MFKRVRNFLQTGARRRGSALLIVLGFLSFMIISGVSFSIYMRIEHQAASNYRHNITARHLLNAGLARAMEDIDAELRVRKDYKVRWNNEPADSDNVMVKFPRWKDWPGRVKVSAGVDKSTDVEEARVLSLEGLSYLPAVLVNDVRRFARRSEESPKDPDYMGAKWRQLSRSIDDRVIGRYAYVCVNVSDMFDLNRMSADQPLDSTTNRVSFGHLFDNKADREKFDENSAKDRRYLSMQDFYTARYDYLKSFKSSPYHEYITSGEQGLARFGNKPTDEQTFISETLVKAEPANKDAFAIYDDNDPNLKRIFGNDNFLAEQNPERANALANLSDPFWEAISRVPADGRLSASGEMRKFVAFMLKDYLDGDNIPSNFTVPTVEMVPMVSQIVILPEPWAPKVYSEPVQVGEGATLRTVNTLRLQLFGQEKSPKTSAPLYVELLFPFKYAQHRQNKPTFTLEVEAYLYLAQNGDPHNSNSFKIMPIQANRYYRLKQTHAVLDNPWTKTIENETDAYLNCFVTLEQDDDWEANIAMNAPNEDGDLVWNEPFDAGRQFSVSLIVFARVKAGNDYVDSAPQLAPAPRIGGLNAEAEFVMTPKLFFQSEVGTANSGMDTGPLPYEWISIETPDPRFNHNASNWVRSDLVQGSQDQTPPNHVGINQSTKNIFEKNITDREGRDHDIFMTVSDAGYMQSPGELGFIVRPFTGMHMPDSSAWELRSETRAKQEKYMWRTFRLYDHSSGSDEHNRRDFIYNNFTAGGSDSFLPGARINPLSTFDHILESALWNTPLDYYLAASNNHYRLSGSTADLKELLEQGTFNHHFYFNNTTIGNPRSNSNWEDLVEKWSDALIDSVTRDITGRIQDSGGAASSYKFRVDRDWRSTLSDVYGDWDRFKWYAQDAGQQEIFDRTLSITRTIHEVDRKMLYSYSLDSFSDRQQLFLYFIRAEASPPSISQGTGSGSLSLAGGRAVALVWRDPYPHGYNKDSEPGVNTSAGNEWYPKSSNYTSPWIQYYIDVSGQSGEVQSSRDPRYSGGYRWDTWHDTHVLFFKQLK